MAENSSNEPQTDEDVLPQLFHHCVNVYAEMAKHSSARKLSDDEAAEAQSEYLIVYEGFLVKLITDTLHLSVPFFTSVTRELKRMGCVRQLRRGGGSSPSQWELITEPTEDLWREKVARRVAPRDRISMLEQQVRHLNTRVQQLETQIAVLARAIP